ncbi:unnamed protein product [Urochloa decumbens]|uniref:F-box domain-containing protein n=1 Tax=Urochloa decumbens TaxID=240449 RepID=A0ABC8VRB5_9POAL
METTLGSIGVLCEDALLEILARLPSKSVLRCRAVCKRWRRIATGRSFLAAHAARQPRQMLVITRSWTVRAVPLSAGDGDDDDGRRGYLCDPIKRDKRGRYTRSGGSLLASLDGLLVLQQSPGNFVVCNPITRQWSRLPQVRPKTFPTVYPCGFYFHRPSGEYRVLCHVVEAEGDSDSDWKYDYTDDYYITSTSGVMPRRLGPAPSSNHPIDMGYEYPVAWREILHWCSFRPEATSQGKILAFHTVAETFRLMARPPGTTSAALLELDGALCAVAFEGTTSLNIWVLQDYESERWMLRDQVVVVQPLKSLHHGLVSVAISDGADVILIRHCYNNSLVNLCDLKEKKVREIELVWFPRFLAFSESLVSHAFFQPPWCFELGPIKFCD